MEESILKTVKNILGVAEDQTVFDLAIITHINTAFSVLHQLGVGSEGGFFIDDDSERWVDFSSDVSYNMIRSYIFLKVRLLFDPPTTSFVLDAMNNQAAELEWRISLHREWSLDPNDPMTDPFEEVI